MAGWISVLLAVAIAARLASAYSPIRGTTLVAPWAWTLAAVLGVGLVEAWGAWREGLTSDFLLASARYGAAVSLFCPLVALLGAKRPQDGPWQWIVASLWCILNVPLFHAIAQGIDSSWELTPIWKGFVVVLATMTLLCYGPTRYGLSATVAFAGQMAAIGPFVGLGSLESLDRSRAWALGLLCAAAWLTRWKSGLVPVSQSALPNDQSYASLAARWRNFIDQWGFFWGIRLAARLNQTAEQQRWPLRFGLFGLVAEGPFSRREEASRPEVGASSIEAAQSVEPAQAVESRDDAELPGLRSGIHSARIEEGVVAAMDAALWRFERRSVSRGTPAASAPTNGARS